MSDPILIMFFILLALAIIGGAGLLWYRRRLRKKMDGQKIIDSVFLEVLIPRETGTADKEKDPAKEEKDMIGVAEQLFATLGHLGKRGYSTFLHGRETLAFEIVSVEKKISFLINCPGRLRDLVEKQIQAQYPAAQVDLVLPPKIVRSTGGIAAYELGLQKKFFYPIKTYKVMESDPLNALVNSLSKLAPEEAAAIQFVLTPASGGWRSKILRRAREIQKSGNVHEHDNPLIKGFQALFSGAMDTISNAGQTKPKNAVNSDPAKGYQQLTPLAQDAVKKLEEKASKNAFEANLRVVISSRDQDTARGHLRNVISSFMQYSQPPFNGIRIMNKSTVAVLRDYVFRSFEPRLFRKMILNTEECASIFHFPTRFTQTPNIRWLSAKRAPAPVNIPAEGLLLGENSYRGTRSEIRMARDDRRRHMYIIGRTGTGKSEFIKNMVAQDMRNGEGVAVIDPHGDLVEALLAEVPRERADQVVLFEPFDMDRPMGLNMLEVESDEQKDFAVQEMIEIFYKLFPPEMIGPMFEHNMRNVMLTLMADTEHPGTIAEIPRMFTDPEFQRYKLSRVSDPVVRAFWEQEMAKTSDFHKSEMLGYLISKVGRFVENEMMRNIIGQAHSAFNLRRVMDEGQILFVNLSKGKTGEVNSKLLGLIIVSKLQMAAMSRADIPESDRRDFYLYIDEFQNFVTDSIATILSEARKYKLNLIMAHQYISQLTQENNTKIRDAVFGNAGTVAAFRIGVEDAEVMAKEFAPVFSEFDVINIDRFNAYIKMMINGTGSRPFNLTTLPPKPVGAGQVETAAAIKKLSKLKYGRPRADVEGEISANARLGHMPGGPAAVERTA